MKKSVSGIIRATRYYLIEQAKYINKRKDEENMAIVEYTVMGARLKCNFGSVPGFFLIPIPKGATIKGKPIATELDFIPFVNIPSFGVCKNKGMPCTPATTIPWEKTKTDMRIMEVPAVTTESCLICALGGRITVETSGQ